MAESLGQLREEFLRNPAFQDNSFQEYCGQAFQQAELGDPTLIQQIVETDCQTYQFIIPTPASEAATVPDLASR